MGTDVKARLAGFASRGISQAEVKTLVKEVGDPKRGEVDLEELRGLKAGRSLHKDEFSAAALTAYDRFLGAMKVREGKVEAYYQPFRKQWKFDSSAAYRKAWNCATAHDPKAPTFERAAAYGSVPSALKKKFEAFALAKGADYQKKGLDYWPGVDLSAGPTRLEATRLYDRDHKPAGYVLRAHFSHKDGRQVWLESYYRADQVPVGWDTSARAYD